jgi:poly(3-hydroxybutyrate) depolymerase
MMISLSVLPPLLAVISAVNAHSFSTTSGCGKELPDGIRKDASVDLTLPSTSGVTPRKYRLHIPRSYNASQAVPLILSFHGRGKDAKFQEALSQFSNESYGFDGIVVYPEGVPVCQP